jgi:hypothetical protein
LSGTLGSQRGLWGQRYDDVNLKAHKLGRQLRQLVELPLCPSKFKIDILALDIAEVL